MIPTSEYIYIMMLLLLGWTVYWSYIVPRQERKFPRWLDIAMLQKFQSMFLVLTTSYFWFNGLLELKEAIFMILPIVIFIHCVLTPIKLKEDKDYYTTFILASSFILFSIYMIISSRNLFVYFLGMELISFSLIILLGSRGLMSSAEGAIKLFFMSAISGGFFLLGIAGFYSHFGTVDLSVIALKFQGNRLDLFFLFLFIALFIKLPVFPFHPWYADVYGSVQVFIIPLIGMSTLAYFYSLIRIGECWASIKHVGMLALQNPTYSPIAVGGLFIAFTLGMFITAVTALSQINQVLRFFGYSSVINISLIVFIVVTSEFNDFIIGLGIGQLLMYIINTTTICLLLGDLFKTSRKNIGVEQFRNLSRVDAVTCTVLVFILVSTGGLPITGGFFTSNWLLLLHFNPYFTVMNSIYLFIAIYISKIAPMTFMFRYISVASRAPGSKSKKLLSREIFNNLSYSTIVIVTIVLLLNLLVILYCDLFYVLLLRNFIIP